MLSVMLILHVNINLIILIRFNLVFLVEEIKDAIFDQIEMVTSEGLTSEGFTSEGLTSEDERGQSTTSNRKMVRRRSRRWQLYLWKLFKNFYFVNAFRLYCLGPLVYLPKNVLYFQSFDYERALWMLFQKPIVYTKFNIYVFIINKLRLLKMYVWNVLTSQTLSMS